MRSTLLETKFFHPRARSDLISRARLRERLDRGLAAKVMLISAPPGFGKTTLLADWLAAHPDAGGERLATAWLSLDAGDNDPARFWSYLIGALGTALPGIGVQARELLQEPRPPSIQLILTSLLNELAALDKDVVLVLDDYHTIDSLDVQAAMEFLVEHLPQRVHLVILSRTDPALPLPRLRARGDLIEIRAADLRFTTEESTAYLNGAMGLALSAEDVDILGGRTEGWIAALQLAALSMAGRDDVSRFIAGFAGDDRYVVDYLVEEVLHRQSADVQAFLLETSVLDRMTGALCDAITGQGGGRALLESLDRHNLFLIPLDDRREWYRYHHLFADVLQARLVNEQPGRVGQLHRLASDWYEQSGQRPEAIRHAVTGGDFARAAGLLETELPTLRRERRDPTMRSWLEALPRNVLRVRPVLCNALAGARLSTGTTDGVGDLLDDAERWLDPPRGQAPSAEMIVVDQAEFDRLRAGVNIHRAGLALVQGDIDGTVAFARVALDQAVEDDHLARGAAFALTGLAAWTSGNLEAARTSYSDCLVEFVKVGHVADVLGCSIAVADIQVAQGRLRDAMRTFEQALELAGREGSRGLRGTADMHVGMAAVHRQTGDLSAAREELARSRQLGDLAGLPQNAYRWRVVMAQLCLADGDVDAAFELFDEAERLYVGDFSPNVRPVAARRARAQLHHGRLDDALVWARAQGLSADDDLSYLHEFEHITLAKVIIAQHEREPESGHLDRALGLLARLRRAADDGHRPGSLIEIHVTQALADQLRGDLPRAIASLESALSLGEPEGYVRTFADEGAPMAALLLAASRSGIAPAYVARLQAAMRIAPQPEPGEPTGPASTMVEPLSSRERDVLRLLNTDLTGPEIARELVLSLNTVRTHTKNVYLKLGVSNRQAALSRARELDLL